MAFCLWYKGCSWRLRKNPQSTGSRFPPSRERRPFPESKRDCPGTGSGKIAESPLPRRERVRVRGCRGGSRTVPTDVITPIVTFPIKPLSPPILTFPHQAIITPILTFPHQGGRDNWLDFAIGPARRRRPVDAYWGPMLKFRYEIARFYIRFCSPGRSQSPISGEATLGRRMVNGPGDNEGT